MKMYAVLSAILLISCQGKKEKIFLSVEKNGLVMEGFATKDSLFTDTVFYYDSSRRLLRKDKFENGRMNGVSVDYYSNGQPSSISYYTNGIKNGDNSYFDTSGNCDYKDYYYYDLSVGSIVYFNKDGSPRRYFFVNLQNETLVDINYLAWSGVNSIDTKCINFTTQVQRTGSVKKLFLFLYLLNPPRLSFRYSIIKKKRLSENEFTDVMEIENEFPFKKLILPEWEADESYAVRLNVFDSLLNRQAVIIKDIN
ncbi:MAG: hypothetical protein EOO15_01565 [Chitinophagaceae bacterium]|nr:MAG: hypothetical protein EOO15_01565 [Chitinophagaceae bacterium]